VSAPFARRTVRVRERRSLGRYVVLVTADELARAEPGQFYMVSASERWGAGEGGRPFLGRALSVMRVGADGGVEFLLEDVGPGTGRLCELEAGEGIDLVGPLGNGFGAPAGAALLVGGGIGVAPLLAAQDAWGGDALLGFRDRAHAQAAALFADPVLATDDGSRGHHGPVTDLLSAELARAPREVLACGPPAMLDAVRAICVAREVPAQLALEAPMACGFGACWGCVVPAVDGYRRVCVDGPVFAAAELA
jgi:NAD(P)H-flavin reductase